MAYGFRLLADIAVRALSPAVNDPTTAIEALDHIEDGLLRLAPRPLGPVRLLDATGRPRVACPAPRWADHLSLALDEILVYGAGNPQTVRRLHALFDRLLAPRRRTGAGRWPSVERRWDVCPAPRWPTPCCAAWRPGRTARDSVERSGVRE
ncbi:hypothetical protein EASAB2608_00398 [Streptomyces sp. EAS-AB2608]|nr:hypothetical protein EASAB2608_00398 [Streptomyces sp. EAS-AB2608]CUW32969.1 hypothetical protein TUE45_pSRTUE45c_0337 [Streptomyces reticuli]